MADREPITGEMMLGEVVEHYPETVELIYQLLGGGCFACPMYRFESVAEAALAHGLDPDQVVARLNNALQQAEAQPAPSPIHGELAVGDVAVAFPATLPVLRRYGLDPELQGDLALAEVAQATNLDLERLLEELNAAARLAAGRERTWERTW